MARAKAWSTSICPEDSAVSTSIRLAWLDCTTAVTSAPMPTNSRMPRIPGTLNCAGSNISVASLKPPLIRSMPKNRKQMPSSTRPTPLLRGPLKPSRMPNTASGRARSPRLALCPASASSQMPLVVPRLAPNTMHRPAPRPISPVPRKAMVSSDTRVLDCTVTVASTPKLRLFQARSVALARKRSSSPPASRRRPSSRHCMPNRNSARPPASRVQPALNQNDTARAAAQGAPRATQRW